MAGTLGGLKLEVVRGAKARELSKISLYKPADFSYALFSQYRKLNPRHCTAKTALRFGKPSFTLHGPTGPGVEGWLIRELALQEIVYLESWQWEPSFFVYTSGSELLMTRFLAWLGEEQPDLFIIKGGKPIKHLKR